MLEPVGHLRGDERVVRDHGHLKRLRPPRHFLADAAEAGQPEHLAAHFLAEKTLLVPLALFHRRVGGRELPGEREQLRHRQFRHADAVGAGRIHHHDAARAGGVDVDVVDAGAGARDGAELRRRRR